MNPRKTDRCSKSFNVNRKIATRTAPIGENGTYTIQTPVGENTTVVSGPTIIRDPNPGLNSQTADVKSGDNQISSSRG